MKNAQNFVSLVGGELVGFTIDEAACTDETVCFAEALIRWTEEEEEKTVTLHNLTVPRSLQRLLTPNKSYVLAVMGNPTVRSLLVGVKTEDGASHVALTQGVMASRKWLTGLTFGPLALAVVLPLIAKWMLLLSLVLGYFAWQMYKMLMAFPSEAEVQELLARIH